jgi:hypothetical protein
MAFMTLEVDPLTGEPIPQSSVVAASNEQQSEPPLDDDIDITDPAELRKFTRIELLRICRKNKGSLGNVPALRELMDRCEGKAPQSVAMTIKQDPASSLSDDQLAALLALLPNPVVIPPMPKKIEDQH